MTALLFFTAAGIILIVLTVLIRTMLLTSAQSPVKADTGIELDPQAPAERLKQAIRFRTISHQDPSQFKGDEFKRFHTYLEGAFPKVHATLIRETVEDYSLLYTWKGQDRFARPILLLGHLDVVPSEYSQDNSWTHDAFEGRIEGGFIWGRGSLDDKSCVLGILEAVERLLDEGFQPHQNIFLAFGHDEEVGGHAGAAKVADLLNERGIEMDYVLDEGLSIVKGLFPDIDRPVALVGIAEKGYLSIELCAQSEGGHSMMPPAHTAIGILSAAIGRIEQDKLPARMTDPVRQMFSSLAPGMPFGMRAVFANLWLFGGLVKKKLSADPKTNAIVRTTAAPTIFHAGVKENILASEARAVVNYRLLPGDTITGVLEHVTRVIDDPRVTVRQMERFRGDPSFVSDTGSAGFRAIVQTIREVFPQTLAAPGLVIAATDSRHYAHLTHNIFRFNPIVLHPLDLQRIHGVDERISVTGYVKMVEFYTRLIRNS